jgi:L-alanine-DL-glutamate epimerase-like enolase superfamily enzyme
VSTAARRSEGRIRSIEIFPLSLELQEHEHTSKLDRARVRNICIKIQTEEGVTGWGEASASTTGTTPESVQAVVEAMAPLVLGASVFEPEAMRRRAIGSLALVTIHRLGNLAAAGYDMACWDAAGKLLGRPVSQLLGGPLRNKVNYFGYCMKSEVDGLVADAVNFAKRGFKVIYFKLGFEPERDLTAVAAVREAVGPDVAIRVDVNEKWEPKQAYWMLRRLKKYDLDFIEAPIDARQLSKMRELRQQTGIPIAGNEMMWSTVEISTAVNLEVCDVAVTGPLWMGGLLPFYQAGAVCAAGGIGLCLHAPPSSGLAVAAALQVMAVLPAALDGNQTYHGYLEDDIVTGLGELEGGDLRVPTEPGLGVAVDEDAVARHSQKPIRHVIGASR